MTQPIAIKFNAEIMVDQTWFSHVHDAPDCALYASSVSKAKDSLKRQIQERIKEGFEALRNTRQAVICTKDGTILIVQFRIGSWGYSIASDGRSYMGGCSIGSGSYEQALTQAKEHAEQCYGGIAWIN